MNGKFSLVFALVVGGSCFSSVGSADEPAPAAGKPTASISTQLEQAKKRATAQAYQLQYKFQPGETLHWKITHLATILTKIRGSEQTAKTRSVSTKTWKIEQVDDAGNPLIVHAVDDVDMWQQVSGRQEIRYNSRTDKTPPPEYEQVAKSIGQPLTKFNVNQHGVVLNRNDVRAQFNPGIGQLIVPLPAQMVRPGDTWSSPNEVLVRGDGGEVKSIKTREKYRLDKVEAGVATIAVETQVLTPVNDPKIQSQLIQRLSKGAIRFDVDAGRLLGKQMDLDETVVGFSGADSLMQYLGRFTEELVTDTPAVETAARDSEAPKE